MTEEPSDAITRLNAALEGRYRIERELGEGGMATVYLADGGAVFASECLALSCALRAGAASVDVPES